MIIHFPAAKYKECTNYDTSRKLAARNGCAVHTKVLIWGCRASYLSAQNDDTIYCDDYDTY